MNKKGFTILELLISILLISIVLLLLLRVMMSLETINHDTSYASDDEIRRTEIIKNVEESFLDSGLNGLRIVSLNDKTVLTFLMDEEQTLEIYQDHLVFQEEVYSLESKNATYSSCAEYKYFDLDEDYYFITITIPVLIDGVNTTSRDDLIFSYLGLKNEFTSYPDDTTC